MSSGLVISICGSENSVWQFFLHKRKIILKHVFEFKNSNIDMSINSSFIFLAIYEKNEVNRTTLREVMRV